MASASRLATARRRGIWCAVMGRITAPRALSEIGDILAGDGKKCYLVGGAVRDYLLGRPVSDFDLASDALPAEVMALFRRVLPTGIKHGTVTVLFKGLSVELTTFRARIRLQ